jgi:hypothetical protein
MGKSPGPAAAQDQADPGAPVLLWLFRMTVLGGKEDQDGQKDGKNPSPQQESKFLRLRNHQSDRDRPFPYITDNVGLADPGIFVNHLIFHQFI